MNLYIYIYISLKTSTLLERRPAPCRSCRSLFPGAGLEYARQDRKLVAGEAIAPKLLLRCCRTAGATRFVTLDLHNQAEAAFSDADEDEDMGYKWRYYMG